MEKFETHHTPGPWNIYNPNRKYFHPGIEADGWSIVVFGKFEDSFHGVQGRTQEESMANAQLIAACPLLRSALIKAVENQDRIKNATDYMVSNKLHSKPYQYPEWYNEAKAAIAAAGVTVKTVEDGL